MPRSDSGDSSGGSLSSEEDVEVPRAGVPILPAATLMSSETASATVAGGTTRSKASQRFRQAITKVIQMNQIHNAFNPNQIGAEPGIDPRRPGSDAAYGHIKDTCEIEVIDYSSTNYEIKQYDNAGFIELMRTTQGTRPSWAKVRWINIAGISWDVISRLGIAYKLHPLTLENIIAGMKTTRSKADYYTNHLFLHILSQSLAEKEASASPLAPPPRVMSPNSMSSGAEKTLKPPSLRRTHKVADLEKGDRKLPTLTAGERSRKGRLSTLDRRTAAENRIKAADAANNILRENDLTVKVVTKSLFLYLLRDGTVISVHTADRGFGDPIYNRLRTPHTILRASADSSLLLEALLDLVVDRALDIVDRYHENLLACERSILLSPKMRAVRQLHFLSGELAARRRELDPVKTLIYGLRRYDQDRCAAVAESSGTVAEGQKVPGYLSHKAKIYLADVHEHCEWILTSFEMFENMSENLINYTFNVIAYETNNTMRTLTLYGFFAPSPSSPTMLTLVQGDYCVPPTDPAYRILWMNFATFPAVRDNSDQFFWIIGGPLLVVFAAVFLWRDIIRAGHYLQKKTILARLDRNA